eukprot:scaffold25497_cov68-Cyclotella_meneghiniana.AAC.7
MEDFVNGRAGIVERNGTKLDRAQVFALPEMEYVSASHGTSRNNESDILCEIGHGCSMSVQDDKNTTSPVKGNELKHDVTSRHDAPAQSPPSLLGECLETGLFVSSDCCSICIEEFVHGERLRILPRCSHAFHTDCILPWLTERQGCCPLCKTPVLPDEYQRNRRSRRSNSDSSNSPRNRFRSILRPTSAQSTNDFDEGNRNIDEFQHDIEGS